MEMDSAGSKKYYEALLDANLSRKWLLVRPRLEGRLGSWY